MRYAVLGGDMRFVHLTAMLNESGREAIGFLQGETQGNEVTLTDLKKCSCIISNWPMRWPLSDAKIEPSEILDRIVSGSVLLLCGPHFPKKHRWDLQMVNLWEDEKLLRENAYLTAEGAVASAIRTSGKRMENQSCLIIGYGRIGQALAEILLNLDAKVTVISSSEHKRQLVQDRGGEAASPQKLNEMLRGKQVIFSTPPAIMLDRVALNYVDASAYVIDLASPPYGVDLEAAQTLNLRAWRESGLPGRYCPLSAARAIFHSILRWEEKEYV